MITGEEIRELAERKNGLPAFHFLLRFSVHLALLYFAAHFYCLNHLILSFALFYLNAVLWHFLGYAGISHELFHNSVFKDRRLNNIFYNFTSYLSWNNPYFFKKSHGLHHAKTFSAGDVEIFRQHSISFWGFISLLTFNLHVFYKRIMYTFLNAFGFIPELEGFRVIKLEKIISKDSKIQFHACLILLTHLILVLLMYFFFKSVILSILLFVTPFTGTYLNTSLAAAQHLGFEEYKNDGPLFFSRSIELPNILAFFYGNMNYHAEHHFAPAVPYYNLQKLQLLLAEKKVQRQPIVKFSYIFSSDHLRLLHEH